MLENIQAAEQSKLRGGEFMGYLYKRGECLVTEPHIPMLREDNIRTGFFEREEFESVRKHLPEHYRSLVADSLCRHVAYPRYSMANGKYY